MLKSGFKCQSSEDGRKEDLPGKTGWGDGINLVILFFPFSPRCSKRMAKGWWRWWEKMTNFEGGGKRGCHGAEKMKVEGFRRRIEKEVSL